PDRHDLAHGAHLRAQVVRRLGELLEGEARHLRDDVVDRRLERRLRLLGDVVGQLVEVVAHGAQRRDLRDRVAGRLGGQGRRARDAGVHLDDDDLAVVGVHRELDVRAARVDADLADDRDRRVAQALVLLVGERLRRRDRDAVAGMHAHRVEVLDRADDHDRVVRVAHHLELVLLPPEHRLLDEDAAHRGVVQPLADDADELPLVPGDAAAGAAEGEARPDDRGEADRLDELEGLLEAGDEAAGRRLEADARHRLLEELAVLALLDRGVVRADELHAVALEDALLVEPRGQVQGGLTAQGGQQRVGPLDPYHLGNELGREGLDVGAVGHVRVGHDRGGVRVHQHDLEAGRAQGLAGLRPRVVELGRLPDDDGPGADDQDLVYVLTPRHEYPSGGVYHRRPRSPVGWDERAQVVRGGKMPVRAWAAD